MAVGAELDVNTLKISKTCMHTCKGGVLQEQTLFLVLVLILHTPSGNNNTLQYATVQSGESRVRAPHLCRQ